MGTAFVSLEGPISLMWLARRRYHGRNAHLVTLWRQDTHGPNEDVVYLHLRRQPELVCEFRVEAVTLVHGKYIFAFPMLAFLMQRPQGRTGIKHMKPILKHLHSP